MTTSRVQNRVSAYVCIWKNIGRSNISNGPKLDTTQVPLNNRMSELTVVNHALEYYITMKTTDVKPRAKT